MWIPVCRQYVAKMKDEKTEGDKVSEYESENRRYSD